MKDWYSRVVFTVIAVALSVIALKMPMSGAQAMGESCGSASNACYIEYGGSHSILPGLPVYIMNR